MDIQGVAIISGGASGIGLACAIGYAAEGASAVSLVDINAVQLAEARQAVLAASMNRAGFQVAIHVVDVRNEEAVAKAIRDTKAEFGRIDYAVNSAGMSFKHQGTADAKVEDWKRVLDLNLNGVFYCVKHEILAMREQEPLQSSSLSRAPQRGSIINISSICGTIAIANSLAYVTSKHGVIGMTRNSAEDHAKDLIRVNAVCPGYIKTPMSGEPGSEMRQNAEKRATEWTTMGRFGAPEEIADAVMFLSGARSSYMTGSCIYVDGGYTSR